MHALLPLSRQGLGPGLVRYVVRFQIGAQVHEVRRVGGIQIPERSGLPVGRFRHASRQVRFSVTRSWEARGGVVEPLRGRRRDQPSKQNKNL